MLNCSDPGVSKTIQNSKEYSLIFLSEATTPRRKNMDNYDKKGFSCSLVMLRDSNVPMALKAWLPAVIGPQSLHQRPNAAAVGLCAGHPKGGKSGLGWGGRLGESQSFCPKQSPIAIRLLRILHGLAERVCTFTCISAELCATSIHVVGILSWAVWNASAAPYPRFRSVPSCLGFAWTSPRIIGTAAHSKSKGHRPFLLSCFGLIRHHTNHLHRCPMETFAGQQPVLLVLGGRTAPPLSIRGSGNWDVFLFLFFPPGLHASASPACAPLSSAPLHSAGCCFVSWHQPHHLHAVAGQQFGLFVAGLLRHHPHHLHHCPIQLARQAGCCHLHSAEFCFVLCGFASASPVSSAPLFCFLRVCFGITSINCTAVLLFAGLLQHHQHHLHRCHILQGVALFLQVCLGISIICTAVLLFAGLLQHHQHHLHRCHILQGFFVFAGLPRHHPHHLHRCFAFCGFAPAPPASSAPLPHSAGFLCFCRFASASPASSAPLFCCLRVCFGITSIICTAAAFCRVCFDLAGFLGITRIIWTGFASASPASFAPLLCFLRVCFSITSIICTAVLLFAGLPRHHPHHLHRCFAFCGFASASPASIAPLPHSAGCCFVFAGLPRHHPSAPLFCFLRVCFGITSIICTAAAFCRNLH